MFEMLLIHPNWRPIPPDDGNLLLHFNVRRDATDNERIYNQISYGFASKV